MTKPGYREHARPASSAAGRIRLRSARSAIILQMRRQLMEGVALIGSA